MLYCGSVHVDLICRERLLQVCGSEGDIEFAIVARKVKISRPGAPVDIR